MVIKTSRKLKYMDASIRVLDQWPLCELGMGTRKALEMLGMYLYEQYCVLNELLSIFPNFNSASLVLLCQI
jgi:hypothetical protein